MATARLRAVALEDAKMLAQSVVVCEAQPLMLEALVKHFETLDCEVLGHSADVRKATVLALSRRPNVFLLGIDQSASDALAEVGDLLIQETQLLVYGRDRADVIAAVSSAGAHA